LLPLENSKPQRYTSSIKFKQDSFLFWHDLLTYSLLKP
jgi:hypothetical protein